MKRRWFQIHLTTAFVLMIVASWLVYSYVGFKVKHGSYDAIGWRSFIENPPVLIGEILGSIAVLFATGFLCEYLIRRREARTR